MGRSGSSRRWAILGIALAVVLGLLLVRSLSGSAPAPEDRFYYTGPTLNHNGDMVGIDGKIIQRGIGKPMGRGGR